jgi:hypothetical protein
VCPCAHCPFRSDYAFGLRRGRCEEIAAGLFEHDETFPCHETTHEKLQDEQHCAGALILHEKLGRPNWRIRFAAQLGLFDPSRLHLEAPVSIALPISCGSRRAEFRLRRTEPGDRAAASK